VSTREPFLLGVPEAERDSGEMRLTIEQAFRQYRSGLLRFLRHRTHDTDDAEDVLQETYTRLVQNYREKLDSRTASTLIFRIATNVANDLARRRRAHHAADHCTTEQLELASEEPSQERRIEARQELELLYQAISDLPPKCQQVFLLNRVDRMTYPQIAEYCGTSVKMVEKHITRALAILRARVGDTP